MPKRSQSGLLLLALFIVCLCAALGYLALRGTAPTREISRLKTFAEGLGYQQEAQLAQYKRCWGIFLTECGQILYFSTGSSLEEFQVKLGHVAPAAGIPKIVDGYTLLEINSVSDHTLSINGMTDPLDRAGIPEPTAYGWLDTEGGEHWVIRFYETAQDGQVYKIDGKPIIGNIVMIMLQTK